MSQKKSKQASNRSAAITIYSSLSPQQVMMRLQQPTTQQAGIQILNAGSDPEHMRFSMKFYPVQKTYFRLLGAVGTGVVQRWQGTESRITVDILPDVQNPVRLAFAIMFGGFLPFLVILALMPSLVLKLFWGLAFIGAIAVLPLQIQRYRQQQTAKDIEARLQACIGEVYEV